MKTNLFSPKEQTLWIGFSFNCIDKTKNW